MWLNCLWVRGVVAGTSTRTSTRFIIVVVVCLVLGYVVVVGALAQQEVDDAVVAAVAGVRDPHGQPLVDEQPLHRHLADAPRQLGTVSVHAVTVAVEQRIVAAAAAAAAATVDAAAARRAQVALDAPNPVPDDIDAAVRVPYAAVRAPVPVPAATAANTTATIITIVVTRSAHLL